jgi:DNA-binding NarL/FixJ family response regulator
MVRILLADDHPIVREGLRALLETQPDFEVVAECANGDETLAVAAQLQADMLLLDLEMPIMDGVETTRRLRQLSCHPCIIIFTAFDDDDRIINAIQAGADGYLLKDAPRDEIFKAIRITIEGGSILQPVIASKSQQKDLTLLQIAPTAPTLPAEELSEREREVLRLLAQGMPNKEIAAHLIIRERTAKFHISSIMNKLGATNRTEAVALAIQRGLITLRA